MNQPMPSEQAFDVRHYILGRRALPPSILAKESRVFVYPGSITVVNGQTGNLSINIHDDAYFLVEQIQIISSDQTVNQDKATVQITDTTSSQSWSNIPVPLRDLAGNGNNPKYLAHPNILRPSSNLVFAITNNSGADATYYVALVGRKIKGITAADVNLLVRRMWYQYVLNVTALGASALNQRFSLQVYNESDFMLYKLLSQELVNAVIGATGGAVSQEVTFNLKDTTTDTDLMADFVAARLLFGAMQSDQLPTANIWGQGAPFCLKKPWLIRRNGIIQGTFNNLSTTAHTSGFKLTLEGIRIFDAA